MPDKENTTKTKDANCQSNFSDMLCAKQCIAILVRDLGYTAKPRPGHDLYRHQLAWEAAVEALSMKEVALLIEELST